MCDAEHPLTDKSMTHSAALWTQLGEPWGGCWQSGASLLSEAFGSAAGLDVALSVTAVKCVVWLYLYVESNLGEFCLDLLPNLILLMSGLPLGVLCHLYTRSLL